MNKNGLIKNTKVHFEIYGVTCWTTINYNTHIAQYVKKNIQPDNEILSVNRKSIGNIFLEELYTKGGGEASHRSFFNKPKFSINLDQQPALFLCYFQVEVIY